MKLLTGKKRGSRVLVSSKEEKNSNLTKVSNVQSAPPPSPADNPHSAPLHPQLDLTPSLSPPPVVSPDYDPTQNVNARL